MKHPERLLTASIAFVLAVALPVTSSLAEEAPIIQLGDFAVYSIGDCGPGGAWFYPPFFGFPDAENASDQIHFLAEVCFVKLRWDVVGVTGGTATVDLQMSGWGSESRPGQYLHIRNESWQPWATHPVYLGILEVLHAKHTLLVDLDTMDVTEDGAYIGRWTFHVTPAEMAVGRAEIVRNWLEGSVVSLPLQVTKGIEPHDAANLKLTYGVDTFANIRGGGGPIPDAVRTYMVSGWGQKLQTFPVAGRYHDPATSLLLLSYSWHYDDLLFNLSGLLMLTDWAWFGPERSASFIHLAETNIFEFPESDSGDSGGGSGDDGGGDAGGDPGQGSEDDGGGPGDGTDDGGSSAGPPAFPWSTVFFFAAVAVLVAVVAFLRLRPPGGKDDVGP